MASVASNGASPLSGYEPSFLESTGDDESWAFIDPSGSSNSGSVTFLPSPASGSLASYGIVGYQGQVQPSPPAPSPLFLDGMESATTAAGSTTSFPMQFDSSITTMTAASINASEAVAVGSQFMSSIDGRSDLQGDLQSNMQSQIQSQMQNQMQSQFLSMSQNFVFDEQQIQDLAILNTFPGGVHPQPLNLYHSELGPGPLDIPQQLQSAPNVPPWNPTSLKQHEETQMFIMEGFSNSPSPQRSFTSASASLSPRDSASPQSPLIKQETANASAGGTRGSGAGSSTVKPIPTPSPIRKVRGPGARVEKKKSSAPSSSLGSDTSSLSSSTASKFVIVTPHSITANSGKHNVFECFEVMRTTQKGRKGPLANETKENALQVRRLGACFCCHARKVKCDAERPCKNCKKLAVQVPQVVCWQFQDFLTVLFPDFIRMHFKKEEMTKFMTENISGFTVNGAEMPCTVELSSGSRFYRRGSRLTIQAKFFTAKTPEVLQHWHLNVNGNTVNLQSRGAAPIGLETDVGNSGSQRDELRKAVREYIASIIQEEAYADQLTDALKHTLVPRKVLRIVQRYSQRSDAPIVKKAMSIYAMHYVLTRHLCLTKESINRLADTHLVPQNVPWVTPRVLNRQIKSVIDEMLMREMQVLFESFSKSLKPKSRKEWAPCTAAFLVLCLFMEALETAADRFVITQNEIDMRNRYRPHFRRSFAFRLNKEVENLPFRQFAYQFHQIYQTHSRDAATKAFNPILDESLIESGELDEAGAELAHSLRELLEGDSWHELDFLVMDPILPNMEEHPFPRDTEYNYAGRLASKFLLSFLDDKIIFADTSAGSSS